MNTHTLYTLFYIDSKTLLLYIYINTYKSSSRSFYSGELPWCSGLKGYLLPFRHPYESISLHSPADPICKQLLLRDLALFLHVLPAPGFSSIRCFLLVIKYPSLSLSGRYSRYKMAIHPAPRQTGEYIRLCMECSGAVCFNIRPTRNVGPIEKSQISSL